MENLQDQLRLAEAEMNRILAQIAKAEENPPLGKKFFS